MPFILKMLLVILTVSIFQGCKKEDADYTSPKEEYTNFLNTRNYFFSGTLPDSTVLWKYGVDEFQGGASSYPVGTDDQAQKSLSFDLVSNNDLSTSLEITTPSYSTLSDELFSKTLAEGDKEIGGKYNKFELALTLDKKRYTTNGDQTNSILKVLKVEKSKDEFNTDVVLVWFKVDCKFYCTIDQTSFILKDGYILAGFMYNL